MAKKTAKEWLQGLYGDGSAKATTLSEDQELLQKYNSIDMEYDAAANEIKQGTSDALQSTDIGQQKLMKYLPETLKAKGISGLGTSESTALEALSNYRTQRAELQRNETNKLAALESERETKRTELLKEMNAEQKDIANLYYDEALIGLESADGVEELKEWYNQYITNNEYMSDAQIGLLEKKYGQIQKSSTYTEAKAVQEKNVELNPYGIYFSKNNGGKNWKEGDNIELTQGEHTYYVELHSKVTDKNVLAKMQGTEMSDNAVFRYDGGYYIRVGNDYYRIQARPTGGGSWTKFTNAFDGKKKRV